MGGKSSAPKPPDYVGAAHAQGEANADAIRLQAQLNRMNQFTPLGNLTYSQAPRTFDQSGYDAAMAEYNRALQQYNSQPAMTRRRGARDYDGGGWEWEEVPTNRGPAPVMPVRDNFFSAPSDSWSSTITLSPEGQQLLDSSLQGSMRMQDFSNKLLGQASSQLSTPFQIQPMTAEELRAQGEGLLSPHSMRNDLVIDPSAPYNLQNPIIDAIYRQRTRHLDPQWEMEADRYAQNLVNQGFQLGTEGHRTAMDDFSRRRTDAYDNAMGSSIAEGIRARDQVIAQALQSRQQAAAEALGARGQDLQAQLGGWGRALESRQQQIAEALLNQNQPMNLLSALRSGSQVSMPSFTPAAPVGAPAPAPVFDAAQAGYNAALGQYNAGVAQDNSMMGGLFGLGGLGLQAYGLGLFSDRRLKRIFARVGTLPSGLPLYLFRYLWETLPRIGVIAQEAAELFPRAVHRHPSGYLWVNYAEVR